MQQDLWLVRTVENMLSGPYDHDEICELLAGGHLSKEDELCRANGYWFPLFQTDEVLKNLGVEISFEPTEDETTETETHTMTQSQTLIDQKQLESNPDLPDIPELSEVDDEDTAIITSRQFRQLRAVSRPTANPQNPAQSSLPQSMKIHKPQVWGRIEKNSVWKVIATVLMFWVVLLVAIVILIVRQN